MMEHTTRLSAAPLSDTQVSAAFESVFSALEPEEQGYLLKIADRRAFDDGDVILAQGSPHRGIWLICAGQIRVEIERANGDSDTVVGDIAHLGAGEIFGEMAFVDGYPASASVVANGRVQVLRIQEEMITALTLGDPTFGARFFRSIAITLAGRMRAANQRVEFVPRTENSKIRPI